MKKTNNNRTGRTAKKLRLHRETLRLLQTEHLRHAVGGEKDNEVDPGVTLDPTCTCTTQ